MNANGKPLRQGYPLSALFLLIAASSVVLGMVAPLARGRAAYGVGGLEVGGAVTTGAVVLMAVGLLIGLFHHARLSGVGWGLLIGFFLGSLFGPMILIPPKDFPVVLTASLGGSAVVLLVAILIRLNSRPPAPTEEGAAGPPATHPQRHPLDPDPKPS